MTDSQQKESVVPSKELATIKKQIRTSQTLKNDSGANLGASVAGQKPDYGYAARRQIADDIANRHAKRVRLIIPTTGSQ